MFQIQFTLVQNFCKGFLGFKIIQIPYVGTHETKVIHVSSVSNKIEQNFKVSFKYESIIIIIFVNRTREFINFQNFKILQLDYNFLNL